MSKTAAQRLTQADSQEQADGTAPKPQRAESPQEFYRRITKRPEIRELLRRLAKR